MLDPLRINSTSKNVKASQVKLIDFTLNINLFGPLGHTKLIIFILIYMYLYGKKISDQTELILYRPIFS